MNYQVFLSFKNTSNGQSTIDSQVGESLYAYLTNKGINVFFSNVSLLEFGESAYKDAIDDALDEVNMMVVIGSEPEYLSSKWCKYEWQNYQQNLLANIVKGSIITYIGDIDLISVPTAIRHYQSFNIKRDPVEKVGDFVIKALERFQNADSQPEAVDKEADITSAEEFTKGKIASYYNPLLEGELKRLTLQGRLTKGADTPPLEHLKEIFKTREKVYILDVGCGYGTVSKDRFSDWENAFVVGIDIKQPVLEKARLFNDSEAFVFEKADIDSDSYVSDVEAIMEKYNIEGFDLIFGAYVLQHIKDPVKFLRKSRGLLKSDGYVLFRNTADKSTISYGDEGLVKKIQDKTEEAPGNANRDTGLQLYHHLYTTGYKQIKVYGYLKDISNLNYDERMEIFKERFSWRSMYFKMAHEENPTNIAMKNSYEWMKFALEKLEDLFGNESFWYGETIINVMAKKNN